MLCDCIRRICGDAQNSDTALCCRLGIDVVETGAAQKDQLDAALAQDLNYFARSFVIDEDADCVIALCQVRGLDGQTAVEILDIYVVRAFAFVSGKFAEEHAVIVLSAEECDLEDLILFGLRGDVSEDFLNLRDRLLFIGSVSSNI